MGFGNEDAIDKVNRARIKELENRTRELESGLRALTNAFRNSTAMTQGQKQQTVLEARRVLNG